MGRRPFALLAGPLALAATLALAAPAPAASTFSSGQLQSQTIGATGCGTNSAGEPSIHVSRAGNVFAGSELGIGSGSVFWRGLGAVGGAGASGCALEYRGQPNTIGGLPVGLSGGDIDIALGSAPNAQGNYNIYVASLNLASVNEATSTDNGTSFSQFPVQGGIPVDDREWIAAFGANTSLMSYHDVATGDIDILRSDMGGAPYIETTQAIPLLDYKATNNELGNLVIDHRNLPSGGGFYAYQSFVAPSSSSGTNYNEAWVAVSSDGGHSFTDRPVSCSISSSSLDHNFPNISVDPAGNLWYAWSDDKNITTAVSRDHGQTWTCSPPVSTNTAQAIFPWIVATSAGEDLVYYASPNPPGGPQTWYVYFAQNLSGASGGWGTPEQLLPVHTGTVCESGATCNGGRQLFDDFGIDTDNQGWAHIAYSHDSPALGGGGTYTGYAVQTGGTPVGAPNN